MLLVDCRKWAVNFVDCLLFKPLKGVDCRLETCLRCRFIVRNLRLDMKIVDFATLGQDENPIKSQRAGYADVVALLPVFPAVRLPASPSGHLD